MEEKVQSVEAAGKMEKKNENGGGWLCENTLY